VTPTPYGGKLAHEDTLRSARIAGAAVVEDVVVSQSSLEADVLTDPEVRARVDEAVRVLVDAGRETVAA
jgi:hypothetical protein